MQIKKTLWVGGGSVSSYPRRNVPDTGPLVCQSNAPITRYRSKGQAARLQVPSEV